MKKLLTLFLSLIMALSLAACSAEEVIDAIDTAGQVADILLSEDADSSVGVIGGADGPTAIIVGDPDSALSSGSFAADLPPEPDGESATSAGASDEGSLYEDLIDEDGTYNSAEDVSLYLHIYGHLPDNYVTKSEARELGWSGNSVEPWAGEGCAIGGSRFYNSEGLLPNAQGRQYYECDIDTVGRDTRGPKRIVYSNDGLIYYTEDHYKSFELLYGEE